MFIIYINDIDVGLNNFISKFADDTKIGTSIIIGHDRTSRQEDLGKKMSGWSDRWEMPFSVNKCHILQINTRNQKLKYEMNGIKLESVQCVEDLGVTIASNSTSNAKMSQVKLIECWVLLTETSSRIKI